jgi:hypothetical protein
MRAASPADGCGAPDVNAAPKLLSFERHLDRHFVVAFVLIDRRRRSGREHPAAPARRAEHRFVQRAAGRENGIADDFGIEALHGLRQ